MSKQEQMSEDTLKEDKVENIDKAQEMAKTEDIYKSLAINTRKAGLEELAEDYEKLGGEEAQRVGQEWEEKEGVIKERINQIVTIS